MHRQRSSTSNSSQGVRWSLDSIELEQPSLRLMTTGHENFGEDSHSTNDDNTAEQVSSHISKQGPEDVHPTTGQKNDRTTSEMSLHSPSQSRVIRRSILFEWWEEILSVSIAVVCTASSVAILAHMDDRSLNDWNFNLQPNTLIALLATLTRAALIYPLAECLGHLKWRHYERPGTLAHLQAYDAASRGPLGAIKYLWKLPVQSPLATSAASITILLLLLQPFAQQTMNFASRTAPMWNETAYVVQATGWNMSKVDYQSVSEKPCKLGHAADEIAEICAIDVTLETDSMTVLPALSYGLYRTISENDIDNSNNGHCSTSLCEFPDYRTLAICSECEERPISGSLDSLFEYCHQANFTWKNRTSKWSWLDPDNFSSNPKNTIRYPSKIVPEEIQKMREQEPFAIHVECEFTGRGGEPHSVVRLTIENEIAYDYGRGPFMQILLNLFDDYAAQSRLFLTTLDGVNGNVAIRSDADSRIYILDPMKNTTVMYGCDHEVGFEPYLRSSPNTTMTSTWNTIMKSTCLNLNTDVNLWFNGDTLSDKFGFLNGTETTCRLFPCIQRIVGARMQNNRYTARNYESDTRWHPSNPNPALGNSGWYVEKFCQGRDEECQYYWTPEAIVFLGALINSTIAAEAFYKMYVAQTGVSGSNYTLFFQKVAAQMSATLQSPSNSDTMNITGIAYGTEVYVQVRWLWFILPLVLLASTLLIVFLSISDSSSKNYLFKNKILAAIFFELHGWEPHDYGVDGTWTRQSMRHVEKKAERMVVRMQLPQDDDGGLRLKKE